MKQLIKHIISYVLALCLFVLNTSFVHAAEPQVLASYDLEEEGTQTFLVNNQDE